MSFSEFYQRSITQPASFWADVSTGSSRLLKRWITAIRRLPAGFAAEPLICAITLSTAGWTSSRMRWR